VATAIEFRPRWREELEAISADGKLVFELGAGDGMQVYFPDEARWQALAPAWAQSRWAQYVAACKEWCAREHIRFSLEGDAHFHAESQIARLSW
jgi:hypothetical protein